MESAIDFYNRRIDGFGAMSFEERRDFVVKARLDKQYHTRPTLKALFRVKPSPDAISEYGYINDYGMHIECFTLEQCIPMRPISVSQRSSDQLAATQALVHRNRIRSGANQAALLAKSMMERDVCVIDCETTDLDGVVIQVAIVSTLSGKCLFESYVATDEVISEGAYSKHGIDASMLVGAPSFDDVAQTITAVLNGRQWTAFNIAFDELVMRNSLNGDPSSPRYAFLNNRAPCLMYHVAVPVFGARNRHGTISLTDSLDGCGLSFKGAAHQASVDALATASMVRYLASIAIED
ncbi:3'-5' exonuclease [Vibrio vulnificus]|nr:3'-5' exonuclease [Vibrio vulnificus]